MGGETVLTDAPADDSQLFGFDAALLSDQVIGGDPLVASLKSPASGGGESWRDSGNLRGAVPVLDEVAPPDTNVVEDAQLFFQLQLSMMQAAQEQQQLLARFMVDGAVVDQRYWFAKSYYLVTLRLLADAADSKYYYPSFVLLSMLYFKKAYVDNLDRWDLDRQCEWQWQVAFGYSEAEIGEFFNSKVPALSPSPPDRWVGGAIAALINVMRSAEAHLRFDLSRCVAWIYLTHYPSDIVHLSAFRDDFFNMAALFDAVTADMQAEIDAYTGAIFTGLPAEVAGLNLIDIAAEYGNGRTIDAEREATWARAQDLVDAFGIRLFSPYSLAYGPADSTFQYLQLSGDVTRGDYLECFDEIQNPPDMEASALLEPVLDYITGI